MFFAEAIAKKTKRRYELKEKLGEGGMGAVWRALDTALEVDVAMKLLLDVHDPNALRLFYEECEKQAALSHPNIVEIRDKGTLEEGSARTPYIVMPLLRGRTLSTLIRSSTHPLPTARCLDIATQASRGLQAAHDAGLLHRDIKPSNLFVLEDDSVKLLDFGVAHRLDISRTMGRKGTLLYMSPEQLEMKALTRSSDVFGLGVVCYEMLTREQPFLAANEEGVAEAIRSHHPPLANSINAEVSLAVSHVVSKAMAKNHAHRFATMREFSEALRRAQYDTMYTVFEPARFEPRVAKARAAFEEGNLQYSQEMTDELLSEGYVADGLLTLERDVKAAVKQQTIVRLMESARARMRDGEYRLALQRVSEVLELEPRHIEALVLRHEIETSRAEADIREWLKLGQQHLEKQSFSHARQAAQRVLESQPSEERALDLLAHIERREQEMRRLREQKRAAYAAALEAESRNEITTALSKMRYVLDLEKEAPDTTQPGQFATYESLYNKLHAEHEAVAATYGEAKEALERGDYAEADEICNRFLERMPQHTLFKSLKFDIEQRWRRAVSQRLLETEETLEHEPDLTRRVEMLEEAVRENPGIAEFERLLEATRQKRNLVEGIVSRARELESRELYAEALVQWETLETIHAEQPNLKFEIENVRLRRELSERMEQKTRRLAEINDAAERTDFDTSLVLLNEALAVTPGDSELLELGTYLRQQRELAEKAERLLRDGRRALDDGDTDTGLQRLRAAYDLGSKVKRARTELIEGLLAAGRAAQGSPRRACAYLEEILMLDPGNHAAKGLLRFLEEQTEHAETDEALAQARQLRTAGDLADAIQLLQNALARYPRNARLRQLLNELDASRSEVRGRDLDLLRRKRLEADSIDDHARLYATAASAEQIAARYHGDEEFQSESRLLKARLQTIAQPEPMQATEVVARAEPVAAPPPRPSRRVIAAAVCVLLILLGVMVLRALRGSGLRGSRPSPLVSKSSLPVSKSSPPPSVVIRYVTGTVFSDPAGATIRQGAKVLGVANPTLKVSLPAGDAVLVAELPGYAPQSQSVQLREGSAPQVSFRFGAQVTPSDQRLDVAGLGHVQVDGAAALAVRGVPAALSLTPGAHVIAWTGEDGSSDRVQTNVAAGAPASVDGLETAHRAIAVSALGNSAAVYAADGSPIIVDGRYRGVIRSKSLSLNLSDGDHWLYAGKRAQGVLARLTIGSGRQLALAFGAPSRLALLTASAAVDGVMVRLMQNDALVREGVTAGGKFVMAGLPAGQYLMVSTPPGSQTPIRQPVELKANQEETVALALPSASGAILVRAMAGAPITVDGVPAGQAGPDGTLAIRNVATGSHRVEARIAGRVVRQDVAIDGTHSEAMRTVSLQAPAVARGVITLTLAPAESKVAIYGENGQSLPLSGNRFDLPVGKYRLEASAPGYAARTVTVDLGAGQNLSEDLSLYAADVPVGSLSLNGWDGAGWSLHEKEHTLTHDWAAIGFYGAKPATGYYRFSGVFNRSLLHRGQKVQWVLGYRDANNYMGFTLANDALFMTSVAEGVKAPPEHFALSLKGAYQVMLQVSRDEVLVSVRDGGHWDIVHDWKAVKQDLGEGRFGFNGPVALTSFAFSH